MLPDLQLKLEALEEENRRLRLKNEQLEIRNESLSLKLQAALRRLWGRSSEKVNPDQLVFDFMKLGEEASKEIEAEEAAARALEEQQEEEVVVRKKKRGGRRPLPANLPVREELIDISPEKKLCPCGCGRALVHIRDEVTEELEYEPAQFFIRRIRRPVYITPHEIDCKHSGALAPLPPRPIDRGRPGPGLLAHLAVSKYGDHLPLYRLEQIFARGGVELSRKTMCDWLGEVAGLLEPVVDEQKRWLLEKSYLQGDESPVQVMDPSLPGKTRRGWLWAYTIPWAEVVYDFKNTRSRAGPSEFLSGYKGHLHTDGYAGYDEIVKMQKIVRLACWAHARRTFFKALPYHPVDAKLIVGMIQKLYHIEREAKASGLDPQAKVALRRKESAPILEVLELAIREAAAKALPESLLGKAAQYALGRWDELTRYVDLGEAEIDNNSVEHAMRSLAVGRKNWLFLGSPEGGGLRIEVFYSLIVTCKRLGANPEEYLRDVLQRVSTHPASRVRELLPRFWIAERGRAQSSPPGA